MRRRGFLSVFGFGAAATVAGAAKATTPVKRDINWARKMCQEGHRVRLLSWRVPAKDRSNPSPGTTTVTFTMGDPSGVGSVDHLALTGEMLEGPWELVPPEDMSKPVDYMGGGDLVFMAGNTEPPHWT